MRFNLKYANENVRKKLQLYSLATDLFNKGKSFPEVLEILNQNETDSELLQYITDKAMHEDWDNVYKQSKEMLDQGVPLVDLKKTLKEQDGDNDVVDFICERWYYLKLNEVDLRGSSGRLLEGGFKALIFGSIYFFLVYQITQKWYFLILSGIIPSMGLIAILFSLFLKLLKTFIHKINNEPAGNFISEKKSEHN